MKDANANPEVHLPKIIEEKIKKQIDESAKEPEGAHEDARVEREPTITKMSSSQFYAEAGQALRNLVEKVAAEKPCPGGKIRSKGKGRGAGVGGGKGPLGVPIGKKGVLTLEDIKKKLKEK
jgi:hypothetical protein